MKNELLKAYEQPVCEVVFIELEGSILTGSQSLFNGDDLDPHAIEGDGMAW